MFFLSSTNRVSTFHYGEIMNPKCIGRKRVNHLNFQSPSHIMHVSSISYDMAHRVFLRHFKDCPRSQPYIAEAVTDMPDTSASQ